MAVTAQTPIVTYDGARVDGVQKVYNFNFHLIRTEDLDVRVGNTLVKKSDYTVAVQNNQGGTITFTTAPAAGSDIMIRRATPFQRDNDYQDNGDLRAQTIDEDFDRIWLALQEQKAGTDIVISRPVGGSAWDARALQISHLADGVADTDAATVGQVSTLNGNAHASAIAAGTSETAAKTSETNAKTSETNAKTSETNAKTSEANAATSAKNLSDAVKTAGDSATNALGSAGAAKTSETNAKTSENSVAGVAAAALKSQQDAATSAGQASTSETNAGISAANAARDAATVTGNISSADTNATAARTSATAAATAKTAAETARDAAAGSATAAKTSETNAKASENAAIAARDAALNVAPGNYVLKTNNLSDLADKAAARTNLALDRIAQAATYTAISSPDGSKMIIVDGGGVEFQNSTHNSIGLPVNAGGTGALTAAAARANLGLSGYVQTATSATMQTGDYSLSLSNAGEWGVTKKNVSGWVPLGILQGGTGATDAAHARTNLELQRFVQFSASTTMVRAGGDGKFRFTIDANTKGWGAFDDTAAAWVPLGILQGGTGATTAADARTNLGLGTYASGAGQTIVQAPAKVNYLYVSDSNNAWGAYANRAADGTGGGPIPLQIGNGGTGATDVATARTNLSVPGLTTANTFTKTQTTDAGAFSAVILSDTASPADVTGRIWFWSLDGKGGAQFIGRARAGSAGQLAINLPTSNGTLALQGTSGRAYKESIAPANSADAMARVMGLELVNFVYKDDGQQRQRFGVIAEDAEQIAPQYVKHNQFPVEGTEVYDDEGNQVSTQYRDRPSVDVNPIVMDLLGCIQNLQAQIDELKAKQDA